MDEKKEKKWYLTEFVVVRKKHERRVYVKEKEKVQNETLKMNLPEGDTLNVHSHQILSFNTISEKVDIPQSLKMTKFKGAN